MRKNKTIIYLLFFTFNLLAQHSITVDGDKSDWIGTASLTAHGTTFSSGEWIYTGNSNDHRTDPGSNGTNNDIIEIRIGQNGTTLYFMIEMQDITDISLPRVSLLVGTSGTGGSVNFLGDEGGVSFSNASFTGDKRVIDLHYVHDNGGEVNNVLTMVTEYFDGGTWFNSGTNSVAASATNDVIEFSLNLSDLGLTSSSTLNFALCTFGNNSNAAQGSDYNNDIDGTNDLFLADFVDYMSPSSSTGNAYSGRDDGTLGMGNNNNDASLGYYASVNLSNAPLPVELTSFSALAQSNTVNLTWETATEVNNYGFEIERTITNSKFQIPNWEKVGFLEGHGNSNSAKQYSYVDNSVRAGQSYSYRLKQIDFDGQFEYSSIVNVEVGVPMEFSLAQNYPNPFNPTTSIEYSVPSNEFVTLKVYDVLGNTVSTLVNETKEAGKYNVTFDASNLTSGIYFYSIKAGGFTQVKKMMLVK